MASALSAILLSNESPTFDRILMVYLYVDHPMNTCCVPSEASLLSCLILQAALLLLNNGQGSFARGLVAT